MDSSEEGEKLFACPFSQRNPSSFGHGKWKICRHSSWKDFHRVREHVYRKHILPVHHCGRCFENLKDARSLLQHGQLQCQKKPLLYYTTADQISQLRIQMKRGIEEFEKWSNMYCILFPRDIRIPSPYKDKLPYSTEKLEAWAAEIERIKNSPSSDARQKIEQIMSVAKEAIRDVESPPSRAKHDLREASEASNTTSRHIVAPEYSGTPNMSSTPGLDPFLEYMELSTDFMNDQLPEVPTSIFGGQDDSALYTLDPLYGMDPCLFGTGTHIDAFCPEQTLFAGDTCGVGDTSQIREAYYGADLLHREDSTNSQY